MAGESAEGELLRVSDAQGGATARGHQAPPVVPGYEVLEEIGRGGMSVVYRGRDPKLDRFVAVKVLAFSQLSTTELDRLRAEARLAAKLRHPNIVQIYEFLPEAHPPCFMMELVEGVSIDKASSGWDFRRKAEVLAGVARAICYAHRQGIVHGDLKPNNILVDSTGEPRVVDFGLGIAQE